MLAYELGPNHLIATSILALFPGYYHNCTETTSLCLQNKSFWATSQIHGISERPLWY